MTLSSERRAEILAAVGAWLDTHADEPLPAGLDPSLADDPRPAPDLATAIGAIIGLRHDVKLQTKTFKRVEEQLAAALAALAAERERVAKADPAADLVELYDRLRRCALACADAGDALPWLLRRADARQRLAGIGEGVELVAERAGAMLATYGLRPFDPRGEDFDAARMRAVGRVPLRPGLRSGSVAETLRAGIERVDDGVVLRPAEVLIARQEDPR